MKVFFAGIAPRLWRWLSAEEGGLTPGAAFDRPLDCLMLDFFDPVSFLLLAQGGQGEGAPPSALFANPLTLIILLGLMFYFLVLRPESRRRAEMQKILAGIKKNDEVITAGGIWGVVANAPQDSEYVWLRLDDSGSTRIKVLRSSISRVLTAEKTDEKKTADKSLDKSFDKGTLD